MISPVIDTLTANDIRQHYDEGLSIRNLAREYHVGERRIRSALSDTQRAQLDAQRSAIKTEPPSVHRIKYLRRSGLTMDEIAEVMGYHRATLYRYLRKSYGLNPR